MVSMPLQAPFTPVSADDLLNVYAARIDELATAIFGNVTNALAPLVKVRRTSNLSLVTATDTIITWQTVDDDPDDMWDAGAPTQLTVNTSGVWAFVGQQRYDANVTGVRSGKILYGGTSVSTNCIGVSPSVPGEASQPGPTLQVVALIRAVAGQPVYSTGFQNSGGGLNLETDLGGTYLAAFFLGT